MTALAFPSVGIQNMSMRLRRTVAVVESPFTYDTQVHAHQGARWEAEVSLPPLTHSEARSVEAFIIGLKGREGTFTFGNPLHTSGVNSTTQDSTAIRSTSLSTTTGSGAVLAGTYFQLGNYLYIATTDKAAGSATLNFEPPLRETIAGGVALDFTLPKSTWRMAANDIGWSISSASIYGFTFSCIEAL